MNADPVQGAQPLFPTAISVELHQEMSAGLRPSPFVFHHA